MLRLVRCLLHFWISCHQWLELRLLLLLTSGSERPIRPGHVGDHLVCNLSRFGRDLFGIFGTDAISARVSVATG